MPAHRGLLGFPARKVLLASPARRVCKARRAIQVRLVPRGRREPPDRKGPWEILARLVRRVHRGLRARLEPRVLKARAA